MNPFYSLNQNNFKKPISKNHFEIINQISNGGICSAFKAKYLINENIYILKTYEQKKLNEKNNEIDYLRTKAILYDLTQKNFPYTVKLLTDFEDVNSRYFVMEYCEGTTLDKLRDLSNINGYISEELVIHILTQLLETLKYLHETCKVIHRNIKPDNILLDKNNNVKLLGFRFSAYLDNPNKDLVSRKSLKGPVNYVAPEIILFPPPLNYDYKADVFSLGFTIYALMNPSTTEKINLPQETENKSGTYIRINNHLINNFYSPWLIEFVQMLYDNDPQKRPSASDALKLLTTLQKNPQLYYNIKFKNNQENQNIKFMNLNNNNTIEQQNHNNFNNINNNLNNNFNNINNNINNNMQQNNNNNINNNNSQPNYNNNINQNSQSNYNNNINQNSQPNYNNNINNNQQQNYNNNINNNNSQPNYNNNINNNQQQNYNNINNNPQQNYNNINNNPQQNYNNNINNNMNKNMINNNNFDNKFNYNNNNNINNLYNNNNNLNNNNFNNNNNINNNFIQNNSVQLNNLQKANIPLANQSFMVRNIKSIEEKKKEVEKYLQSKDGNEGKIISSMKCILKIFYSLDIIKIIKSQLYSLFSETQTNYKELGMYIFIDILDKISKFDNRLINKMVYSQSINEFIRKIFIANNSGISGTRPIILYYMITSIFKDEIKNNFDSFWQNRIFDNIINSNFTDFNCIIPMNNPKVHEGISKGLLDFKNNYKGPFVDNFYFMTLTVSACPECNNIFGVRTQISPFLQLDVTNSQNSISQIINNYFCSKIGVGNYVCNNCGFKGKKIRKAYCLNLPNYLVLEFEDKNALNFNDNVALMLYNGKIFNYEYLAAIYKYKDNSLSDFVAVIKNGNTLFFYNDDKIEQCPESYINLENPSLAIYKKISD